MKLKNYEKWLRLSYDEFVAAHRNDIRQINEEAGYEKITNAINVDLSTGEFLFFKHGTLKLIYTSDDALTKKLWDEFKSLCDTNTPEKTVRSRAGKTSNQLIFASKGITASLNNDNVDFIEIYSPCSMQDYLNDVYNNPGLFIR